LLSIATFAVSLSLISLGMPSKAEPSALHRLRLTALPSYCKTVLYTLSCNNFFEESLL